MTLQDSPSLAQPVPYSVEDARKQVAREQFWGTTKDHAYSKPLAARYGTTAAVVLKYLYFCVRKSRKTDKQGRQMTVKSLQQIARQYPYLSESAIHEALKGVPPELLIRTKSWSRSTCARSSAYAFSADLGSAVDEQLVYFSPTIAESHGVSAATVLHRIQYEIRMRRKERKVYTFHPVSATELAGRLGLSRATVGRAIRTLVDKGFIRANPKPQGRMTEYELVERPAQPAAAVTTAAQNRN